MYSLKMYQKVLEFAGEFCLPLSFNQLLFLVGEFVFYFVTTGEFKRW